MPKKIFKIKNFSKGLVGNASPRDIPEDGMSYGENIDSRVRGKIEGIRGDDTITVGVSKPPRVMAPVLGSDNLIVGQDSDKNFVNYDVDADSWSTVGAMSNYVRTIAPVNDGAILSTTSAFRTGNPATPKMLTDIDSKPFDGSSVGYSIEDSECKSFAENQDFSDSSVSPFITLGHIPGAGSEGNPALFKGSGSVFTDDRTYYWAVSLIYDGYQESPLIKGYNDGERWGQSPSGETATADICLRVGFNPADLPDRITGFNIYRAEAPSGGDTPTSSYKLMRSISNTSTSRDTKYRDIDANVATDKSAGETVIDVQGNIDNFIVSSSQDNVRIDGNTYQVTNVDVNNSEITIANGLDSSVSSATSIEFAYNNWIETDGDIGFPSSYSPSDAYYMMVRDEGAQGSSYEDNTGVSDTLETTSVDYKIAAEYGSYLFVGGCDKDEIDDAEKYVFRSKPKTYSIIDWSRDFVILPEEPNALIGFGGRLYAFGSANIYRINPLTMDIEDTYAGVGALNENMVVSTNFGMFHADDNNIYHNTGTVSQPIGDPILTVQESTEYGWQDLKKTNASNEHYASMAFDPKNKRLLLFAEITGDPTTICWAYDVERKRWDLYPDFDIPSTTAVGPSGTLYATMGDVASGFDFKTLFTSSSRKNWKVKTKEFDLGSDSGDFWAYDLQGYGGGNFNIKYAKDGGSLTDNGTSTVDGLRKTTVASADKKMKSIAVQAESASGSDTLDNLTIQFRPQVIQE